MPLQYDSQQATASSAPTKPSSHLMTIIRGQVPSILQMDNPIVDFLVITPSPHIAGMNFEMKTLFCLSMKSWMISHFLLLDAPDPSALVVLLENDLAVIDLKSEK